MTTRRWWGLAASAIALSAAAAGTARLAYGNADRYGGDEDRGGWSVRQERLTGYQEDPLVVSTSGSGRFSARIDPHTPEISYQLSYEGLAGEVTQAHLHLGGWAQSGGISIFLCTNLGNGPAGTQPCPAAPASISGTIRAADVIGPDAQGIAAGEIGEVIAAIRAGRMYVNVHTSRHPGGEIRAQLGHRYR
ncbi:CHRD domain-containing protein [Micromonospora sp. HM5-17]|jgi:hypothetical protein|uniref:CHRD domain-containing protein n=1 Tax=Micromonospora sp. HM5-17 TaxID=2487710 RepID=UPI000F4A9297|nr:CHRD domain-containing protein [Micromonospora sp. HM5-17]ROT29781.1 CHRD domain-containing protein [Micromonospora sp. HM5-17]